MGNNVAYIDELNDKYCVLKKQTSNIDWQIDRINDLGARIAGLSDIEYIERLITIVNSPDHNTTELIDSSITDLISVGKYYLLYIDAIKKYEKHLLGLISSDDHSKESNVEDLRLLEESHASYETSKKSYEEKYGKNSLVVFVQIIKEGQGRHFFHEGQKWSWDSGSCCVLTD